MNKIKITSSFLLLAASYLMLTFPVFAQNFNVASTYQIGDAEAKNGDIIISAGAEGLKRTDITYDQRIFGVLADNPIMVLKNKDGTGRPIIRAGDVLVNVSDYNGSINKGDYVTTSPVSGVGMKAGQSGYVVGLALDNAQFGEDRVNINARSVKVGTVKVAIKSEYAEITTSKNALRLLEEINAALFRNIGDPEKFVNIMRYFIGGLIGISAFGIGFFWISRSVSKSVEAIGRNPLAKQSIYMSVIFQIGLTIAVGIMAVVIIFILVRT